ncbi:Putative meiotically up-regulated protein PB1A10.08 [Septoria linicola]|uniref:Meiotically up-regulated protein PB1A10.08 n=1 Tax=Septoria linicola TaxID=215465 RepID=A0A9Q9ASI2_9PEZI|nr:putative meiotically up-regulated protein PB1A10.08 [Septoria linicola]USW49946.1 Putative meiotically up-regulated protein PB1A10.08 [Septoria linicola]
MLVPSSFKYSSAAMDTVNQRDARRSVLKTPYTERKQSLSPRSVSPKRIVSEPVSIPPSKASNVALAERAQPEESYSSMVSKRSATINIGRRKQSAHDPNALPPAVAALLAVTAIPPRRPNRYRSKPDSKRRISIEELISEWKSDGSLRPSFGSPGSGALSILLEDDLDSGDDDGNVPGYLNARSASSDSMPSLDSDDQSILSMGSPSTPGSLRSRRSFNNLKKEKPRSLPASVDCGSDHPLIASTDADVDGDMLVSLRKQVLVSAKSRSSFKSNLTASLQTLKEAAVNSISSLGRTGPMPSVSRAAAPPMDDMLWSHPFLFPRFSSEVRPAYDGTPSQAERRYLNPMPLTFEEQEAPFQEALHAPFLAQPVDNAPTIQMQTYNRGRKRQSPKRAAPNPSSEAGRALLGQVGARQREVRENSDFLRVVVLEMNMRREGKLEQGRAKIWLPPRQSSATPQEKGRVPKRWIGESA